MYNSYRLNDIEHKLNMIGIRPLDVMVTGITGAGKSSTLNAIFEKEIASVGRGVEPETMNLDTYRLNNFFRFWDTPGLGDGVKKDSEYARKLIDLLYKEYHVDNHQYGFVDMVLVIIDGSNRDMGTTYKLLNEIIVPNFQKSRVLVAINQADMAMKGRHWDVLNNKPSQKLKYFLDDKVYSIQSRVKEATGMNIIKPIYYSAEYGYNINALLDLMVDNMPNRKRELLLNA